MADGSGQKKALGHLRVVEIGGQAATLSGFWLAGLGAEVIKVEPPSGDPLRAFPPFAGNAEGQERSLYHLHFNRNKKSIVLDVGDEAQRRQFVDLLRGTDILFEAFSPGYLGGLGLGPDKLREINPRLVVLSVTPFGHTGPNRDFVADDAVVLAASGYMAWAGDNKRPPVTGPCFQAYQLGGLLASFSALAAVHNRRITGQGQWIDFSLQDALTFTCANVLRYIGDRTLTERAGAQTFNGAQIHACKDGYVFIAPFNMRSWQALEVGWMQDPLLSEEPWKSDRTFRRANMDVINDMHEEFVNQFTVKDFVEEAQRRHIPAAPVNTTNDFLTSEQENARGFIIEVDDPVVGRMKMLKDPFGMYATPWSMTGPAPRLDQHRQEVLAAVSQTTVPSGAADNGAPTKRMPLEGIRVLDFTRVRSGPTGTVILADLGAEVIKVESALIENQGGDGVPQFDSNNRNKKSIKVNMKEPRGRELFLELVKKADVVTDNFTYKVMDNLGIGYEDLKKVNPRIIMAGMPPMGKSGPIAGWTTYGQQLMAFSGMSYLWGYEESPMAAHPKVPYPDDTAASQLILSILAALEYRDQTGEGQYIEVAQCEGLAYMLAPAYLDKLVNDNTWGPLGNWHPVAAPFGAYPTKGEDDWVFVSCETEEQWQNLVKVLGNAGWTEEEQFKTRTGRRANKAALDERLGEWTRQYTARQAEWMLQKGRVPAHMVEENEDQYYDLHLWQRGFLQRRTFPKWGDSIHRAPIARFSDTPGQVRHAQPEPGQDSVEVFGRLLGMPEAEVKRLMQEKVIY